MYTDVSKHCKSRPRCFRFRSWYNSKSPLESTPVQRPFQLVGIDIMDLPKTKDGNKHVLVLQDFLTKWLMVYPMPDQDSKNCEDPG